MDIKKKRVLLLASSISLAVSSFANEPVKNSLSCSGGIEGQSSVVSQKESIGCHAGYIEEVVVTGTRTETTTRLHPGSLSLINQQEIQRAIAGGAADLLRDIPGVQVSDAGQAGSKRLRVRGEESRRIAILIDNQEVTDHREVGVPITLDPEMIERVELVRGASSVLYGSKAIGGVVNFITKKGGDQPLQGAVSMSYNGAAEGNSGFVSLYGSSDRFDYRLSESKASYGDRETPEGEIENTRSNSRSRSLYAGVQLTDQQRLELNYTNHESDSEVFVEEDVRTGFPFVDFRVEAPKRDREKLGVFYQFEDVTDYLAKIEFNAYQQVSEREFNTFPSTFIPASPVLSISTDSQIYTTSELVTEGAMMQADWLLPANNYLITGIQYLNDDMDQERLKNSTTSMIFSPAPTITTSVSEQTFDQAEMRTLAAFVQNEWAVTEALELTFGARQYWVDAKLSDSAQADLIGKEVEDDHLVASFSALYSGLEDTVLRFNVSQGYVYPSLLQMATGAYGGADFISPNAELDPETSDNVEVGMRYFAGDWYLDLTAFYSKSKDYIDHVPCVAADDCLNVTPDNRIYKNIGDSVNKGVEAVVEYSIANSNTTPYVSVSWMQRENTYEEFSTTKTGWPEWSGKVGARYQSGIAGGEFWMDAYVRSESSADEETPNGSSSDIDENSGWSTFNLSSGYSFGENNQYKAVMDLLNITDKSYSTATENLLAPGRHVRLKFTANF